MMEVEVVAGRQGLKKVSNWQRIVIKTVCESKNRTEAAQALGIKVRTLDDLLYRAYKVLDCKNLDESAAKLGIYR
jgi:DNA-binding CsgD family transcriptional regulator